MHWLFNWTLNVYIFITFSRTTAHNLCANIMCVMFSRFQSNRQSIIIIIMMMIFFFLVPVCWVATLCGLNTQHTSANNAKEKDWHAIAGTFTKYTCTKCTRRRRRREPANSHQTRMAYTNAFDCMFKRCQEIANYFAENTQKCCSTASNVGLETTWQSITPRITATTMSTYNTRNLRARK